MKVSLGCCYQCDVPPDNIKNLRIFCGRISYTAHTKSVVFAHFGWLTLKKCATTTRNFFVFFWVGPPRASKLFIGWARPVASSLQAVNKIIFIFILHLGLNRIHMAGERK